MCIQRWFFKKEDIGFIAEDVIDIVPSKDHKQIRHIEIISVLTKIVKEQDKKIRELERKIGWTINQ